MFILVHPLSHPSVPIALNFDQVRKIYPKKNNRCEVKINGAAIALCESFDEIFATLSKCGKAITVERCDTEDEPTCECSCESCECSKGEHSE